MADLDWLANPAALWLIAAALLTLAELFVPGAFLIFLAIAAAVTGAVTLMFPDFPVAAQWASFALWSVLTVMIGRHWYGAQASDDADPMLNDRAARLVGGIVTVSQPLKNGQGRVRVGDGEWPARGADMPIGARARIVRVDNGTIVVERLGDAE